MKLLVQKDVSQTPIKSLFGVPSPTRRRPAVADELRHSIGDVLLNFRLLEMTIADGENAILSLLAPILADAEKWRGVKEIAGRNWLDEYPCEGCSVESMCDSSLSLCGQADSIVDALEGEVKG